MCVGRQTEGVEICASIKFNTALSSERRSFTNDAITTMTDGVTQRRTGAAATAAGVGSASRVTVAASSAASAASTSYFSSNASKRRGEIFFLAWGAVWISIMATIVATRWFEVS